MLQRTYLLNVASETFNQSNIKYSFLIPCSHIIKDTIKFMETSQQSSRRCNFKRSKALSRLATAGFLLVKAGEVVKGHH